MPYSDTGIVMLETQRCNAAPNKLRHRIQFFTDATSKLAIKNFPSSWDIVLERIVLRLYGPTTAYSVYLFDAYDSDVLVGQGASIADNAVYEKIIAADLGDSRRGIVRTMGQHCFYVTATSSTFGVVDIYCLVKGQHHGRIMHDNGSDVYKCQAHNLDVGQPH